MKLNLFCLVASLCCHARADVPLGPHSSGDLTAFVSFYGVCPSVPSWLLPPCDQNAPHAVMLNLVTTGPVPLKVITSVVVVDTDGTMESFTQMTPWSPNADGWSSVILPVKGTPDRVLTVSITEILPGQEHVF